MGPCPCNRDRCDDEFLCHMIGRCRKPPVGCKHCYAERVFPRPYPGRKFTDVRCHPERLDVPLRWKRARRIFVNSMSDLFHEDVPDDFIAAIFGVMAAAPRHVFQILTKRPERMREWFAWHHTEARRYTAWEPWRVCEDAALEHDVLVPAIGCTQPWPLPHVWLGVSCEDQATADERIPLLLETPAAVRWISAEPLLGPVDVSNYLRPFVTWRRASYGLNNALDWVVVGGESGPGARPMHPEWARSLRDQCLAAGVPFFMKQITERGRKLPQERWPADLRVQEYPRA